MEKMPFAAMFTMFVLLLAGCGSNEIRGLTKPDPDIRWANVYRASSSAAVQTNRVEFWMTEFACYRTVGSDKLYLDFQYERAEASSDGGRAIYILSNWSNEALQQGYTYYILAGIGAEIYDYDSRAPKTTREAMIAERITRTRSTEYGRDLTTSELEKVNKLAKLIAEEHERNAKLKQKQSKNVFTPKHIGLQPSAPATRDSTPTTDAYDAGLWECLPDGTSHQIL